MWDDKTDTVCDFFDVDEVTHQERADGGQGLALSDIYLSMLYIVLLFIRAPFYVLLVFVGMCSVF